MPVTPYAKIVISKPLNRCLTVGETEYCQLSDDRSQNQGTPTLIVENSLLSRGLIVYAAELERIYFVLVLEAWDAH